MGHIDELTPKNLEWVEKALKIKNEFSVAVVNPSKPTIKAALVAEKQGLIKPILVGEINEMRAIASSLGKNLPKASCVEASSAKEAADKAVELAKHQKVQAIMKGDIHTDLLMKSILSREAGIRTDRRLSHCMVIDMPNYNKLCIVTDAAINIAPDIYMKIDIVQNSIDFAHSLGIHNPQVALLSFVEDIMPNVQATTDAAIICKMADRGQITGANIDGPLSFDLAVSEEASILKHFKRNLQDSPDIFVTPDLNSGNIAVKILDYMADGQSAGIVVGAKVPIILMRRSSPAVEYVISCALAKIHAFR